jgi:hypothetical protein
VSTSRIVHDLLMTLGFFALTQFEFDLNIVAAPPSSYFRSTTRSSSTTVSARE